jgi:hypothetical protein
MLPAVIAIAMLGVIGAFGGSVRTAEAVDGDICHYNTNAPAADSDEDAIVDHVVELGVTYDLVFRVEDTGVFDIPNVTVRADSETGAARITSYAEITDIVDPDGPSIEEMHVDHVLVGGNGVGTQVVDTIDPDSDPDEPGYFTDPDGNEVNGIDGWLEDVAGVDGFLGDDDTPDVCGNDDEDVWGYIDFECIEAGVFHIDIQTPEDTEETGLTLKFRCGGQAESATIAANPTTVETQPTGVTPGGLGSSTITVTVLDQFGDRLDGAEVTFSTDNCQFRNTDPVGDNPISPAGGGTTVTTFSDSDTTSDDNFLLNNPSENAAGTAEVVLNCTVSGSTPGVAHVTAVVQREGSDIVLKVDVTVVGPTAATGLTLTLTPDEIECGETIKATAKAVDANGAPVSPGTVVHFTTDTSSGVVGGEEGAQGAATTIGGEASVLIATDPGNPGTHTVIAFVMNAAGTPSAQASATYECEGAVAPAAPTVAPPSTGTGTITPPSTGDAGLASGSTSSSLFVIAGAVAFVLAGLASVKFARN